MLCSHPHVDLEEQLEMEAVHQQEAVSLGQEREAAFQQECASVQASSSTKNSEEFPPDSMNLPPPEWPESPLEDTDIPNIAE